MRKLKADFIPLFASPLFFLAMPNRAEATTYFLNFNQTYTYTYNNTTSFQNPQTTGTTCTGSAFNWSCTTNRSSNVSGWFNYGGANAVENTDATSSLSGNNGANGSGNVGSTCTKSYVCITATNNPTGSGQTGGTSVSMLWWEYDATNKAIYFSESSSTSAGWSYSITLDTTLNSNDNQYWVKGGGWCNSNGAKSNQGSPVSCSSSVSNPGTTLGVQIVPSPISLLALAPFPFLAFLRKGLRTSQNNG